VSRPPPRSLAWAFPDLPVPGVPRPVVPGVHWLRMPLPFEIDHINLWLLEDRDGWTLVDTGAAAGVTQACWDDVFASGCLGGPVRRIVITHFHPDHIGCARRLAQRTGAPVCTSAETWRQCHDLLHPSRATADPEILAFCARHEVAHAEEFGYFLTGGLYRGVVDGLPSQFVTLADGDTLETGGRYWRWLVVGGHAAGHGVLACAADGTVIAGDQVLPTITSNVSKFLDEGSPDPLDDYLESLRRLETLPAETLVLPSHGRVFRGLHARIAYLRAHHQRCLERVLAACAEPKTTGALVTVLFPQVSAGLNYMMAFGETRAHVIHLVAAGRLRELTRGGKVMYEVTGWQQPTTAGLQATGRR
jgi:glyoxylase-like metal-dependent hydrolase (beta-lactamase superfamily II)